jgi:hypothetical protein
MSFKLRVNLLLDYKGRDDERERFPQKDQILLYPPELPASSFDPQSLAVK